MSLPLWNSRDVLDEGVHAATMADVYDRMVLDAPHREHREMLFHALASYMAQVSRFVQSGRLWIDGGFSMRKPDEPHDVDVVVIPDDPAVIDSFTPEQRVDFMGLLTLQDVIIGSPGPCWMDRVQPVGGALDGFVAAPDALDPWLDTWSTVKRNGAVVPGERKGFAEVRL
ncbi:DUF6932 family protein [Dietzia sp. PP-33]|uniref:DUF6932 family protein n=1 Tax=Dietzia sp. PP-33 TaxID=2957500 RepID=UPI0029ADD6BF|nr:hypothetical protein [Dietzia sp. PP-33]MDX2357443.1 hypothetical protein [Dietzia sp. PP-33]